MFESTEKMAPLAERMRARCLSEFFGQKHIVAPNSLLNRAIRADKVGSCIFWGPPGCGKTTLAYVIANSTSSHFEMLNAVSSGVADAKRVIDEAQKRFQLYGQRTYLLLDECHRWSKAQSDCVLMAMEKGIIQFIGSTTENPYVAMTPAIVSRCKVFEFKPLSEEDVSAALQAALTDERGYRNLNVILQPDALQHIVRIAGGDLRSAFNSLEMAVLTTPPNEKGEIVIDKTVAEESSQRRSLSVDDTLYYDMISAFIKSLRGSDSDAALFWFARLVSAGCDPMLLARRLVIQASEDVGMADPQAQVVATSALIALKNIGMPEARIPLANAILYVCNAPKSNAVEEAIDAAFADAEEHPQAAVPNYLKDRNHKRATDFEFGEYKYPHAYGGYVEQQYLPDEVKDSVYYHPTGNGFEAKFRGLKKTDPR